jgi:hypothetical protein
MRFALAISLMLGTAALSATAQDSVTISSDENDLSRPVSTLIDQIRKREKISITYEDPRYENSADIEDVTAEVSRGTEAEKKYGPRILGPKGHAITFVYKPSRLRSTRGTDATIARMLREYRALGGPEFSVFRDEARLHVIPTEVLDASGNRVKKGSILDTIVSVPGGPRDGGGLLQAICDEVKKQTGYEIGVGPSAPSNDLDGYRTTEGIDGMSARSAIERVLDKSSRPGSFVWDLYYDPGDKSYGLNFSYVGRAGPAAVPR